MNILKQWAVLPMYAWAFFFFVCKTKFLMYLSYWRSSDLTLMEMKYLHLQNVLKQRSMTALKLCNIVCFVVYIPIYARIFFFIFLLKFEHLQSNNRVSFEKWKKKCINILWITKWPNFYEVMISFWIGFWLHVITTTTKTYLCVSHSI